MLQALRQQGLSYSEIARRTGYERRSIANWRTSSAPRDRNRAALNPTSPLYLEAFLAECWKNGNRVGRHLFYDIKSRGYTGSRSNLERLLKVFTSSRCQTSRREVACDEVVLRRLVRISDPIAGSFHTRRQFRAPAAFPRQGAS
jgi:hypothetical protein